MATKIFINLPVRDLGKSKDYFRQLGYTFNSQFTDDKAACLVIGEDIYAMLITEGFFKTFTMKNIADTRRSTEAIIAITAGSREEVDEYVEKAVAAGGNIYRKPDDYGWMYSRSIEDPDGHIWEIFWMDPARIEKTA